ncbi:MAG: NAD(P)H-dependent glycerol-3-phosphate dehydrogenase [bacterium]
MVLPDRPQSTGRIVILGAGNWGTTLACLYAGSRPTILLTRTIEQTRELTEHRENRKYLPGIFLPEPLTILPAAGIELARDDLLLIAVPSHQVRRAVTPLIPQLDRGLVVNGAKGFEHSTLRTMSEVLIEMLPRTDVVTLSGPNIARELAAGKPTRAVLAGKRLEALSRAAQMLQHPQLVFETSRDLRGVELAASLKGTLAIAVGLADGFELGDNFISLLMTYGLREFATLATFMGADEATVYGIAGLGDMITSSLSPAGRNRRFGALLAKGIKFEDALEQVGMVVEGVEMLKTVSRLQELNLPLPLFTAVRDIVESQDVNARERLVSAVLHYGAPEMERSQVRRA